MNATLLAMLSCLAVQSGLERAREALAAGDYHAAWERIRADTDELERCRGQAEILYGAGDPAGALRAARAGLALAPEQIDLIYHAAGAAIWLEDGPGGVDYSARLLRAAETLEATAPEEGRAWHEAARGLAASGEGLLVREHELSRALVRLRSISVGGLAAWLLALWLALRLQGRSSRPVS